MLPLFSSNTRRTKPRRARPTLALHGLAFSIVGASCVCTFPEYGQDGDTSDAGAGGASMVGGAPNDAPGGAASLDGGGTATSTMSVGGGPICGNGIIEGDEACDGGPNPGSTGCTTDCGLAPGWDCSNDAPSVCVTTLTADVLELPSAELIPEVTPYGEGSPLEWMQCHSFEVISVPPGSRLTNIAVTVGIETDNASDLVLKLSASGILDDPYATLVSRPGFEEAADAYEEANKTSADLEPEYPVTFDDMTGEKPSEEMSKGVGSGNTICHNAESCNFLSSPGATDGISLAALAALVAPVEGTGATPDWQLCIVDADNEPDTFWTFPPINDAGTAMLHSATLRLTYQSPP
ncbi:MAG: hypothetical protein HOW73_08165 [Polyangiaceae bacterium]|nr:hypothetical protein [Polyangiaceae bacterium]